MRLKDGTHLSTVRFTARLVAYEKALDAGMSRAEAATAVGVTTTKARKYESRIYGPADHRAGAAERRKDFEILRQRGVPLGDCAIRLGVTERTAFRYEKRRKTHGG